MSDQGVVWVIVGQSEFGADSNFGPRPKTGRPRFTSWIGGVFTEHQAAREVANDLDKEQVEWKRTINILEIVLDARTEAGSTASWPVDLHWRAAA